MDSFVGSGADLLWIELSHLILILNTDAIEFFQFLLCTAATTAAFSWPFSRCVCALLPQTRHRSATILQWRSRLRLPGHVSIMRMSKSGKLSGWMLQKTRKYNSKMLEWQEKHDSVSCNGATENPLQLFILYKIRDHAGSPDSEIYGHSWESFLDPCTIRKVYHIMNIQPGYRASPRFTRHFVNPVAAVAGLYPPPPGSITAAAPSWL